MRVVIAFVVCCAVVGVTSGEDSVPAGFSTVEQSEWPGIFEKVAGHLMILASNKEGQQWKLVELKSLFQGTQVVDGSIYRGSAVFENAAGEKDSCSFNFLEDSKHEEKLDFTCAAKILLVTKA